MSDLGNGPCGRSATSLGRKDSTRKLLIGLQGISMAIHAFHTLKTGVKDVSPEIREETPTI